MHSSNVYHTSGDPVDHTTLYMLDEDGKSFGNTIHIFKPGYEPLYEFEPEEVNLKKKKKKKAQNRKHRKRRLVSLQIVSEE